MKKTIKQSKFIKNTPKMVNGMVDSGTSLKPERQKKAIMERIDNEVKKQGGMFKYPVLQKRQIRKRQYQS